ncbi:Hydrolase [Hexamita inflata]|uniref:Hydrolase n=1 Tax=Hexamita inflata TaxID=28002 RepID=A0AA86TVZ5_9EUKA|nr:Hydrolase [Hexamita inflata]
MKYIFTLLTQIVILQQNVIKPLLNTSELFNQIFSGIKAVIFDLDGTLIDSTPAWERANDLFFAKHGLTHGSDYFQNLTGKTLQQCAQYIQQTFSPHLSPHLIISDLEFFYDRELSSVAFFPFSLSLIRTLINKNFKLGIASACTARWFSQLISFQSPQDQLLLQKITFVSCDETCSKPDPMVYTECMRRLGVEPFETVVFEDSGTGLSGARQSGARVVHAMCSQVSERADFGFRGYHEFGIEE